MYSLVLRAANVLNVCEHRFFELAYHHWHHRVPDADLIARTCRDFRCRAVLPAWARYFARSVVRAYRAGNFEPAMFGVYPAYQSIPLPWALPLRSPSTIPFDSERGVLVA